MGMTTTYFYDGSHDTQFAQTEFFTDEGIYVTTFVDVLIFYGTYKGASQVGVVEPRNLPPLQNVKFNAQLYLATSGGVALTKNATPELILRQDIYDSTNPANCIGTKFTFVTLPIEECDNDYVMVWSTQQIEMPYGADMIFIAAQNGVSSTISQCG